MARPLGAQLHLPHGLANGLLLPYVIGFSWMGAPDRYAEIARLMGAASESTQDRRAAAMAEQAVLDLCEDINLSSYLGEFGDIPSRDDYLDVVGEMAQDAIDSGSPDNNPRKPTKEEIESLYIDVYDDVLAPDAPRRT